MTQGVGAGLFDARALQQKQWAKVMRSVYLYMGKPVIHVAKSTIIESNFNDGTNTLAKKPESIKEKDLKEKIKNPM